MILSDGIRLNVPGDREGRYRDHVDRELTFGIRPEHVTEQRQHTNPEQQDFACRVEVLEPMGIDTMVFMNIEGEDVCARSAPKAVSGPGQDMMFTIDMQNMHLIDPATDRVL